MKAKPAKKRAPANQITREVKINEGPTYVTETVRAMDKLKDLVGALGDPPTPSERTMISTATELAGYLDSAFIEIGRMRSSMFGEGQEDGGPKRTTPTTLTGLLARACEQAASLVGELRTINSRLDK